MGVGRPYSFLSLFAFVFVFSVCVSGQESQFATTTQLQHETVQVWFNGGNNTGTEPSATIDISGYKRSGDFDSFLLEIEQQLPMIRKHCNLTDEEPSRCAPWSIKIYNWRRNRIYNADNLHAGDLLYVVPVNESFIWPGLYVGHKVTVDIEEEESEQGPKIVRSFTLETVTLVPRAFIIEEFLLEEECSGVKALGEASLQASTLDEDAKLSTIERNSKTAWLWPADHWMVKRLCDRASFITHTPLNHQEALQLLHYTGGGYYRSHCDYFGGPGCSLHPNRVNRFITLLFYLNEVEEGGGTNFWRVKTEKDTDDPWTRDTANVGCREGLTIQPKKRKALMFYNLHPEGYRTAPLGDRMSEHTACNVTRGEKWASNFWIWNHPKPGNSLDQETTYTELDQHFVKPPSEAVYPNPTSSFGIATDQAPQVVSVADIQGD